MALLPCHSPGTPVLWTIYEQHCPGKALVATGRVGRPRTIVQAGAGSPGSYSIADQRPYTRKTDFSKSKHHFGVAKVPRKVMTTGYQSLGLANFYCRCQLGGLEISTEEWCYSAGLHSKVHPRGSTHRNLLFHDQRGWESAVRVSIGVEVPSEVCMEHVHHASCRVPGSGWLSLVFLGLWRCYPSLPHLHRLNFPWFYLYDLM